MAVERWYEIINGVSFPFTKFENGIVICDYPEYNPETARHVTEEGRIQIRKMLDELKKIGVTIKENDDK
jgi:hypothetical protein